MKIGIGVITSGQRDLRPEYTRHAPSGSVFVAYVDKEKRGAAYCRNEVIKSLADAGVTHFFIMDDDVWPLRHDYTQRIIEEASRNNVGMVGMPHVLSGSELRGTAGNSVVHAGVSTSFCYFTKECLEKVGYFDERYGMYAPEDSDFAWRCAVNGFTGSNGFLVPAFLTCIIYSQDMIDGFTNSTFSEEDKKVVFEQGKALLEEKIKNRECGYIPYKR